MFWAKISTRGYVRKSSLQRPSKKEAGIEVGTHLVLAVDQPITRLARPLGSATGTLDAATARKQAFQKA
jgi:hypothetical protein